MSDMTDKEREVYKGTAIRGLNRDDLLVIHPNGATESQLDLRFDLLDANSLLRLAHIMWEGVERGHSPEGWRKLSVGTHLNHALSHIMAWMGGNRFSDDHLGHAFCRLMFAVALEGGEVNRETDPTLTHGKAQESVNTVGNGGDSAPETLHTSREGKERLEKRCPKPRDTPTEPRLAYLCHPHGEDPAQVSRAVELGERLQKQMHADGDPTFIVIPHIMWPYLNSSYRAFSLRASLEVMKRCDIVLVPSWTGVSDGMRKEMEEARREGIPIYWIHLNPMLTDPGYVLERER